MNILVLNTNILAVDPQDTGDAWVMPDQIIQKHVAAGAQVIDVTLPDDYAPGRYIYDGGFVAIPPPAPPVTIPDAVSMRQARLALFGAGLLDAVNVGIAAMPGPAGAAARIEWEYASEVRRDSPLIAALEPALGLTSAQIDALFIGAATL